MTRNPLHLHQAHRSVAVMAIILAAMTIGCADNSGGGDSQESASTADSEGEHRHEEGGEHGHGEGGEHGGEESGTELALTDSYDKVRNGARLILAYDKDSNSFQGTVENTTTKTLERVRVEVHLSNGKELGPTKPGDLKPGEKRDVTLTPESTGFDGWTAHPEVGNEEHGHGEGGEHGRRERGEHDREGRGEHDREGKSEHKEGSSE